MGAWRCLVLQSLTEPNALLTELTLHGWRVVGFQKHAFGKESSIDIARFHCLKAGIAHLLMSLAKKSAESDSYFTASLLMHLIILAGGGVGLKMFNFESFFSVIFTLSLLFFWVCFGEFTQI